MEVRPDALECPRCGKRVLVRRGEGDYHCLWCGFRRDISEPEEGWGRFAAVPFAIVIALMVLL